MYQALTLNKTSSKCRAFGVGEKVSFNVRY